MPSLTGEKCRSPSTICQTPTLSPSRWTAALGDQWSGRERRQVNRDFGQFTHWWQRFWFVIECHLGKRFPRLPRRPWVPPAARDLSSGHHANAGRYEPAAPSQPRCADLVEAHIDPQTLGVDHFHHGLARDDGRAGIGIAHGDYTVDRRDQAQIAPLRDECFAVGACPGNIFPSGG